MPKPWEGPYFPYFPYFGGQCLFILSRHGPPNRDPLSVFPWWSAKTMRGSLFPLFPLRVKCQNHERLPISPISPILVANVYSSCQDMDHQNRGNRDLLSVLPWWSAKTMRVPISTISPKGEVPKPWEGPYFPYFPYFGGQCLFILSRHGPPK